MREPTEAEIAKYTTRPNWTRELNFEDQWRARWVEEDELPEDAPVNYAYALVMRKGRGYVTRKSEDDSWRAVETAMEVRDDPEAMVREAVFQQTGATASHVFLTGFFEAKATKLNPNFEIGAVRIRALYAVAADTVEDVPGESEFKRRRLPINEFNETLKKQYPEMLPHFRKAVNDYLIKETNGEL